MNHQQRRQQNRKKPKLYDIHHRKPTSRGGNNDSDNKICVLKTLHQSYHHLFANMMPEEIAKVLNDTWIPTDWKMIAVKR